MSFLLPCPNCGPRDVNEFVYAGEVSVRPQQEPSLAELRARRAVREATGALLQTAGDE